jgi:hypothetical protein
MLPIISVALVMLVQLQEPLDLFKLLVKKANFRVQALQLQHAQLLERDTQHKKVQV